MLSKKGVERMIKEAAKLVDGTEQPYRSLAFSVVLAELLHSPSQHQKQAIATIHRESEALPQGDGRLQTMLRAKFDWSSLPVINKDPITQNLLILKLALDEFKIDGLSAKDIQQVLFQKYRISKTPNAVSMSLMAAVGKYVDRIQEGKEYLYRITRRGIEKLQEKKAKRMEGN